MTLDQFYAFAAHVTLTEGEHKARGTSRLVRESHFEQAARVTPEPDDDE